MSNWTLLSNHGHVLVCLSRDPEARLRDVAAAVGITERAVQKIVRDLQDGGMLGVTKSGRRNSYRIHRNQNLRHELEADCTVNDLLSVVNRLPASPAPAAGRDRPEAAGSATKAAPPAAEAAREAEPKTPESKPKAVKPAAAKKTGAGDSSPADSLEKQQGTLF